MGHILNFMGGSKGFLLFEFLLSGLVYTKISCDIPRGANRLFYSVFFVNGSGQGLVTGTIGLVGTDRI